MDATTHTSRARIPEPRSYVSDVLQNHTDPHRWIFLTPSKYYSMPIMHHHLLSPDSLHRHGLDTGMLILTIKLSLHTVYLCVAT